MFSVIHVYLEFSQKHSIRILHLGLFSKSVNLYMEIYILNIYIIYMAILKKTQVYKDYFLQHNRVTRNADLHNSLKSNFV